MKPHAMRQVGLWMMVAVVAALFLFPLYVMVKLSLSPPSAVFAEDPGYGLTAITFSHYRDVFTSGETFYAPMLKSLSTAFWATVCSILIATPAAYAIAKLSYRVRYAFVVMIFATRMIPEVSIALPISISFIRMGLFDTVPGLVLAHLVRILPVSCFILVSVFASFPADLERQARIDGYSRLQAVWRVVLPLSLTGISVAALFSFLLSWDEFIYASYLTLAEPTMPLKVYYYISRGSVFDSATYAVIITAPVLLLTFALQRYIKPEYLSGAIKG